MAKTKKKKEEKEKVSDQQQNNEQPNETIDVEAQLKEDLAKEKDKFLRLFAEFENYKKRTTKERIELFKTAGQEVIQFRRF